MAKGKGANGKNGRVNKVQNRLEHCGKDPSDYMKPAKQAVMVVGSNGKKRMVK